MKDEPNDAGNSMAVEWDPFLTELTLIEGEILGNHGPTCTCPGWWFPQRIREVARRLPHMYQGVLSHHKECAKTREYDNRLDRVGSTVGGRRTRHG